MGDAALGQEAVKRKRAGFTLIEVVIAIQIVGIGLSMLLTAYAYLRDHAALYADMERQLAYERSFLQVIGREINNAKNARIYQNDLCLRATTGLEDRYNFKEKDKRLDKITPTGGRITMGVALDSVQFSVDNSGVTIIYKVHGSSEKQRFFHFR